MIMQLFSIILLAFSLIFLIVMLWAGIRIIKYFHHVYKVGDLAKEVNDSRKVRLKKASEEIGFEIMFFTPNSLQLYFEEEQNKLTEFQKKRELNKKELQSDFVRHVIFLDTKKTMNNLAELGIKEEKQFVEILNSVISGYKNE